MVACRGLLGLEEQDGAVSEVEIYEVLGLCGGVRLSDEWGAGRVAGHTVSDEAAKVPADDAMPGCALAAVELRGVSARLGGRIE